MPPVARLLPFALMTLLLGCPPGEESGDGVSLRSSAVLIETGEDTPDAVPDIAVSGAIAGAPADAFVTSGEAEPSSFADVRFHVPGTVSAVLVQRGDLVRKGDVLAELETAERQERLDEARRRLGQARTAAPGGTRPGEQPPAYLEAEMEARLEDAQARAARSDGDRDRVTSIGVERGEHAASERALAIAGVRNRGNRRGSVVRRAAGERVAAALVDDLSSRVRQLEDAIQNSVIRAPVSGQVIDVNVEVGSNWNTRSTKPSVSILDPLSLVIRAGVPAALAKVMRPREVVWIEIDGKPIEGSAWQIGEDELRLPSEDGEYETIREVLFTVDPAIARTLEVGQVVRVAIRR